MDETRADRIHELLSKHGRLKVSQIRKRLAKLEKSPDLHPSAISVTVRQDNTARRNQGKPPRFNVFNDGDEEFGYISLTKETKAASNVRQVISDPRNQIPLLIQRAVENVKEQLRRDISELTWQEFEANFLSTILTALGFADVKTTQRTRDGGTDAYCTYRRGLVSSYAIVSAKHWKSAAVSDSEVDRVRGIPHPADGIADTAIIVTSSTFTKPAIEKAKPTAGMRLVVLIDGDLIVQTCIDSQIGVEAVELPKFYRNKKLLDDTSSTSLG
jgi:restriction endonuclease Mrr